MSVKPRLLVQILTGVALTLGANVIASQPSLAETKFYCGRSQGTPATMVRTEVGSEPMIRWVSNLSAAGWTPEKRCQEVSTRFQRFYDNGTLQYIRTGTIRGQRVLCVASYRGGSCANTQVLITLRPGSDPNLVLQQLRDFRRGATSRPLRLTGTGLESYMDGEVYIDVKKLLETPAVGARTSSPAGTDEPTLEPIK